MRALKLLLCFNLKWSSFVFCERVIFFFLHRTFFTFFFFRVWMERWKPLECGKRLQFYSICDKQYFIFIIPLEFDKNSKIQVNVNYRPRNNTLSHRKWNKKKRKKNSNDESKWKPVIRDAKEIFNTMDGFLFGCDRFIVFIWFDLRDFTIVRPFCCFSSGEPTTTSTATAAPASRISTYQWIVRINYICNADNRKEREKEKEERGSEWLGCCSRCY